MAVSAGWSRLGVAVLVLSGLVVLWGYLARENVFGRNWLVKARISSLPASVLPFDKAALVVMVAALSAWVPGPEASVGGLLLAPPSMDRPT
ncbi:MAG: hypothetical protein Q7J57_03255 [Gemmobacter sp.]|nr:hypothetical protein [Gemmobacter sp.]